MNRKRRRPEYEKKKRENRKKGVIKSALSGAESNGEVKLVKTYLIADR